MALYERFTGWDTQATPRPAGRLNDETRRAARRGRDSRGGWGCWAWQYGMGAMIAIPMSIAGWVWAIRGDWATAVAVWILVGTWCYVSAALARGE